MSQLRCTASGSRCSSGRASKPRPSLLPTLRRAPRAVNPHPVDRRETLAVLDEAHPRPPLRRADGARQDVPDRVRPGRVAWREVHPDPPQRIRGYDVRRDAHGVDTPIRAGADIHRGTPHRDSQRFDGEGGEHRVASPMVFTELLGAAAVRPGWAAAAADWPSTTGAAAIWVASTSSLRGSACSFSKVSSSRPAMKRDAYSGEVRSPSANTTSKPITATPAWLSARTSCAPRVRGHGHCP